MTCVLQGKNLATSIPGKYIMLKHPENNKCPVNDHDPQNYCSTPNPNHKSTNPSKHVACIQNVHENQNTFVSCNQPHLSYFLLCCSCCC